MQHLKSIVQSNLPSSTIVHNAWRVLKLTSTVLNALPESMPEHFSDEITKKSVQSKSVLLRGTPATCLTYGEVIAKRKKDFEERRARKTEKEMAREKKMVTKEKRRALKAIKDDFRGGKQKNVDAVEGLLAFASPDEE